MTERIDLSRADDPRDVVHRAVACLAQGGTVGLPTETTYGIVAGALNGSAVAKLGSMLGREGSPLWGSLGQATLLLKGAAEADDWAEVSSELGGRLTRRAWPGAVTLTFPVAHRGLIARLPVEVGRFLVPEGVIALRVPSNMMVREVLRLLPCPLIQVEAPLGDGRWPTTADAMADLHELDMIIDVGPTQLGGPSTIVDVETDRWTISQVGVVPHSALARMAGTILLFICTGNTCRSPMAEALCKALLARKLGCKPEELVDRGVVVLSAGVSAMDGMPAASHAIEVVKARGGSLQEHASRKAAPELVRHADHIFAMTADHPEVLLDRVPDVAPRAHLLDGTGDDIDDPVGSDLATYRRTAREIEGHLEKRLAELGF